MKGGKTVLVAVNGRRNGEIVARLLAKQGHRCLTAAVILDPGREEPDQIFTNLGRCFHTDEAALAASEARLKLPFYRINAHHEFLTEVFAPYLGSRLAGRYFDPCLYCNALKLRLLAQKAKELKADAVAVGFNVRLVLDPRTGRNLLSCSDALDDQAYFLLKTDPEILPMLMAPLGGMRRQEISKLAQEFGLDQNEEANLAIQQAAPAAAETATEVANGTSAPEGPVEVPDGGIVPEAEAATGPQCLDCILAGQSSAFCFGQKQFSEILEKKVHRDMFREGVVANPEKQLFLGEHKGIHNYYYGMRYVPDLLMGKGTVVTVSQIDYFSGQVKVSEKTYPHEVDYIQLSQVVYNGMEDLSTPCKIAVKLGRAVLKLNATLHFKNNSSAVVRFKFVHHLLIAPGVLVALLADNGPQSIVLGHGVVESFGKSYQLKRC